MIDIEKEIMQRNRDKYKKYIYSIMMKNGNLCKKLFKKHIRENNENAININNILNKYKISLRVFRYFIDNPELKEFNIFCPNCGNRIDLSKEYKENCSKKCMYKNPKMKERRKETNLKKYGVENTFQGEYFKEKIKETNLRNLGVESPSKSPIIMEKIKKTNLERRGVETPFLMDDFQEKKKKTHLKKYGYDNSSKSPIVKEKRKNTCLKIYGETTNLKNEKCKEEIKKINLRKYGVEYTGQVKEFKDKSRKSLMSNYRKQHYDDFLKMAEKSDVEIVTPYEEHLTVDLIKYRCKICNTIFESKYKASITEYSTNKISCPECFKNRLSIGESSLYNFISSLIDGNKIIRNTFSVLNNRKQIDIYIPDKKIAVEFNGIYWHSVVFRDINYHINKTLNCKSKGIKLIHVFENDWFNKNEIVKSIISSTFGIYKEKIYASKCEIKNIKYNIYEKFLNENHINGVSDANIMIGIFYKNILVSCIGIKTIKDKENIIVRFCDKLNTKVIGSLNKFIKYSGIKNLVGYVDLRYFDGYDYEKIGFKLVSRIRPNYFYVKDNRKNMINFKEDLQKEKLIISLRNNFDSNLSETENMLKNGYLKIYDCGSLKYKLESL